MTNIDKLPVVAGGKALVDALRRRVLVLDGAMGTMIQSHKLDEADFRGERFKNSPVQLKGLNDLLVLTQPELIKSVHRAYLTAGADIIETNSFNANAFSLADYGLTDLVDEINLTAAQLARAVADEFPGTFVAGSMGPSGKSLSMADDNDTYTDDLAFDRLAETYRTQAAALIAGGVDALLIETVFDGLNAKAAVLGARQAMADAGMQVPVMISVTLTEAGRTLSGQTIEALYASVSHAKPISVGLNCGFGAEGMLPHLPALDRLPVAVSLYPNAGLPNAMGQYDESPETMCHTLEPYILNGSLNIIGGCCGTTPEHISRLAQLAKTAVPRTIPAPDNDLTLAGLEPLTISPELNFLNIGERCNVAGSRKFLRLIKEDKLDEAEEIAAAQVEAGARVIDINMDDAMLDSTVQMRRFISRLSLRPDIACEPIMIDSSHWPTILAGLKRIQGRPVVNSISLKEGEQVFLEKASQIHELGAAMVVMAFDEQGQADTFERKIQVCGRAYNLLTRQAGIPGHDIIFDPNILTVATGMDEHNAYAIDFLRATEWIKRNLPGAMVSGGVSNLSFALRGNNPVREAMHALFLYHGITRGLDMAIVNAGALPSVDDIPADLRRAIDDVIFNTRHDATDRLIDLAAALKESSAADTGTPQNTVDAQAVSLDDRLERAIMRGSHEGLHELLDAALARHGSPLAIIDGPLMAGMNRVGELFGQGKMFLPQVVKSARTMKQAVEILTPAIEASKEKAGATNAPVIILATVKGDVHDIGKNIVGVVMNCNGFKVIDLGVMVPAETIISRAIEEHAAFIGLSGLITPSLEEMCHVAKLMEQAGLKIPLLIGGATTSELHTAIKIAPCYSGPVFYTRDAAMLPSVARRLLDPDISVKFITENRQRQYALHDNYSSPAEKLPDLAYARAHKLMINSNLVPTPATIGITDLKITTTDAAAVINWRAFFDVWKLDPNFAQLASVTGCDHCKAQWLASQPQDQRLKAAEAMQLFKEAWRAIDHIARIAPDGIRARVAILPARSLDHDNIDIRFNNNSLIIPVLRQQSNSGTCLSLADYLMPDNDHVGLFAVTVGPEIQNIIKQYQSEDDYRALLYQSLADRLAEAATDITHHIVETKLWANGCVSGIRPAIGYPSLPDQSLIFLFDKILKYNELGITLTENGAMAPTASTTGLIFPHPQSRYFSIGKITDEQLANYASRRGTDANSIAKFLRGNL